MGIIKNILLIILAIILSPVIFIWYLCEEQCHKCKARGAIKSVPISWEGEDCELRQCANCGEHQFDKIK